jgi:hypothetical protein
MHQTGMNTFLAAAAERSRTFRIIGVAAVLMAAVVASVMFATSARGPQPIGARPAGAVTTPGSSSASSPSASPTAASVETLAATQAAFTCGSSTFTAKGAPATSFVDAMRTGSYTGYDRFVVEFKNGQPGSISIRPQAGTTFNQSPSGQAVKVGGRHGVLVIIRGADAHTAFAGRRDIKTSLPSLAEVRVIEDFEGQVALGLGVSQTACYRAFVLPNPVRLVIDLKSS